MIGTKIEWATDTVNFWWGCTKVSEACRFCYAERVDGWLGPHLSGVAGEYHWGPGAPRLLQVETALQELGKIRRRAARTGERPRVFINSMSDFFEDRRDLDEARLAALAAMMLAPEVDFLLLTKRPEIMAAWMNDPDLPHRVAKAADNMAVQSAIQAMKAERIVPITDFPGYFISDRGRVFTATGSSECLWCQKPVMGGAKKRYCSPACRSKAHYEASQGRFVEPESRSEMTPDTAEGGYQRVTLRRGDERVRELVHRLVLSAFDRRPVDGEQGCHRDGNPSNNALPNLRWGSQSDNWDDRQRHGNGRAVAKLTHAEVDAVKAAMGSGIPATLVAEQHGITVTQANNIFSGRQWAQDAVEWPLPNVWAGCTVENQEAADRRIHHLLSVPATVRFLSCEPLLGPVDLDGVNLEPACQDCGKPVTMNAFYATAFCGCCAEGPESLAMGHIDWVIAGGESGAHARPMHPDWARSLRDQCVAAGVPFHFKQWGEWKPEGFLPSGVGTPGMEGTGAFTKVGKKAAGRLLDGVEHNGLPEVRP